MTSPDSALPVTLFDLLSNTLVLYQTCPYVPISGLLSLAATSKSFRSLVYDTPHVFRYLDLSPIIPVSIPPLDTGGQVWRSQRMDEGLTEEEFCSGPLRGIFSFLRRKSILSDVQTLILDGLSVPADLVHELICDESYNIRILSIREVKNLNERKLMQVLKYAVRPSRPDKTPKLKGLYLFGPSDRTLNGGRNSSHGSNRSLPSTGVMSSAGAQLGMEWNQKSYQALSTALATDGDGWYQASGKMITKPYLPEWASVLELCRGIIAFDAVLCRSFQHELKPVDRSPKKFEISSAGGVAEVPEHYVFPNVAVFALGPTGCAQCHTSPEGPAILGISPVEQLPLLAPLPRHSSTVRAAQSLGPGTSIPPPFFTRCGEYMVVFVLNDVLLRKKWLVPALAACGDDSLMGMSASRKTAWNAGEPVMNASS
ncbi:MAG: hypothetical protein FRX48_03705 [Lasallia pustulata]|uniref:F-box domain-containing protein n=1 Tax=Lasallia pustulata TaxID=136370 RepID=A0A5M8PVJ9_9LECA|nr:MAG: hypothetical protein FRX48_03705 [Lasallia pustulata]